MNTATEYIKSLSKELQERIRNARLKLCVGQAYHEGYKDGKRDAVNETIKTASKNLVEGSKKVS